MLHTLSHSPYQIDFQSFFRNVKSSDAILLLQDGVIAALTDTHYCNMLMTIGAPVFALLPDLLARGLTERITHEIITVNYTQFVALTVQHPQQIVW